MLADLSSGSPDAVIVYNLGRLQPLCPAEPENFVALCEQAGVSQVATVRETSTSVMTTDCYGPDLPQDAAKRRAGPAAWFDPPSG
jgi:hypothetical protein